MKSLFYIVYYVAVALFVAVVILLGLSVVRLSFFPLEARTVLTGSMAPAIPTGSLVFIFPRDNYQEGDIITFKPEGSTLALPITHRIVAAVVDETGEPYFVTMGDANQAEDAEPVYRTDIYGKVVFHIPWLGRLLELVRTPWGFVLLIIIPALMVIYDEIMKIVSVVRTERTNTKRSDAQRTNKETPEEK